VKSSREELPSMVLQSSDVLLSWSTSMDFGLAVSMLLLRKTFEIVQPGHSKKLESRLSQPSKMEL
jgi:hypothetical protein